MKKIYLFLLVLLSAVSHAQIVNIPDANFKSLLLLANTSNPIALNSANQNMVIDTNGDGEIQNSEANAVHQLTIQNSTGVIYNIEGIRSFTNLHHLNIVLKYYYT